MWITDQSNQAKNPENFSPRISATALALPIVAIVPLSTYLKEEVLLPLSHF